MSLSNVREYFRTKLDGLGFTEHRDALSIDNIPSTSLDTTYHLQTESISSAAADQLIHTFDMVINVRIFRRSYNDTVVKHEELITDIEAVHTQVLNLTERTDTTLFDVVPGTTTIEAIGDSNDNWQVALMPFTAIVKLCFT